MQIEKREIRLAYDHPSGFMWFMWLALWEAVLESSYLGGGVGGEELCHVSEACGGASALVPSVGADRGFDKN